MTTKISRVIVTVNPPRESDGFRAKSRKEFIYSKTVRSNWSPTQAFLCAIGPARSMQKH